MDRADALGRAAIAGCGAVCSVGRGLPALDAAIAEDRRAIGPCARLAADGFGAEAMGFISDDDWSAMRQARDGATGPAHLLAADALAEAVRNAESALDGLPPERIALILSTTKAEIGELTGSPSQAASAGELLPHLLAAALAEEFGARAPVQCVSAACVSGLIALQQGARMIEAGRADVALVVGVDVLHPFILSGFRALRAVDPAGCRPFDRDRAGMTPGEAGAAMVLVSPALAARARASDWIRGWGSSNDANHLTGPSRDGSGMALAMRRALESAGAEPGKIDWIHAHATATPYNDAMEALAYRSVFGDSVPPVSGSKGMFGHTFGAAGLLEAIVGARAARLGLLAGTPGLSEPDEAAPPRVLKRSEEFAGGAHGARLTLKVGAGFGGVNAAIAIASTSVGSERRRAASSL